jgi:hypothetical protein
MVRFEPTWEELELYKDGGIAIIDQWICSHARCCRPAPHQMLIPRYAWGGGAPPPPHPPWRSHSPSTQHTLWSCLCPGFCLRDSWLSVSSAVDCLAFRPHMCSASVRPTLVLLLLPGLSWLSSLIPGPSSGYMAHGPHTLSQLFAPLPPGSGMGHRAACPTSVCPCSTCLYISCGKPRVGHVKTVSVEWKTVFIMVPDVLQHPHVCVSQQAGEHLPCLRCPLLPPPCPHSRHWGSC